MDVLPIQRFFLPLLMLTLFGLGCQSHSSSPDLTAPNPPNLIGTSAGSYNKAQSITIEGEPGALFEYSLDNGSTWIPYEKGIELSEEGEYEIIARQRDRSGNLSQPTEILKITLDYQPPQFLEETVTNQSVFKNGDTIQITFHLDQPGYHFIGDFTTIDTQFSNGNDSTANPIIQVIDNEDGTYLLSYTIHDANILADQTVTLTIIIEDAAGNQSIQTINTSLDNTPPYIEWVKTSNGDGISSNTFKNGDTVYVTIHSDESNLSATADFSAIDSEYQSGQESVYSYIPIEYNIKYTIHKENHIEDPDEAAISVTLLDQANNSSTRWIPIVLNNYYPQFTSFECERFAYKNGDALEIKASFDRPILYGIQVPFSGLDSLYNNDEHIEKDALGTYTISYTINPLNALPDVLIPLYIDFKNRWGITYSLPMPTNFQLDNTPPEILSIAPNRSLFKNGETVVISIKSDQSHYTISADFSAIDSGFTADHLVITDHLDATYSLSYPIQMDNTTEDLPKAMIPVIITDPAGNGSSSQVEIGLDNTNPVINIDTITTSDRSPSLHGTVSEKDVNIRIIIESTLYCTGCQVGDAITITGDAPPFTWTLKDDLIGSLVYGFYDVQAIVIDSNDNQGTDLSIDELHIVPLIGDPHTSFFEILPMNLLVNVSVSMEYSLNNAVSWYPCSGVIEAVTFSVGDKVWVRQAAMSNTQVFLGTVSALNARADLVPTQTYIGTGSWYDYSVGKPGDLLKVFTQFKNIGDLTVTYNPMYVTFYLSDDRFIEASDTPILEYNFGAQMPSGAEDLTISEDFTIPSVSPGTYYIGYTIDSHSGVPELCEDQNTSLSNQVGTLFISDASPLPAGAFKVANSWGTSPFDFWENIHDGFYWITYKTMKYQEIPVYYYYNDFSHVYSPTLIVVFKLTHPNREQCTVEVGLGDPNTPFRSKELQMRYDADIVSGPIAFPDNNVALDISEFSDAINSFDLYVKVTNSGSSTGSIQNLSVEYYSDYSETPFKVLSGMSDSIKVLASTIITIPTNRALTQEELNRIQPLYDSPTSKAKFRAEKPLEEELIIDKKRIGVYDPTKKYNTLAYGKYGTGYIPPTEEEWKNLTKLKALESQQVRGTLPTSVDLSQSPYFPPIGDQGPEGSCNAFSFGYYIQTYMEAKEHQWDLSSVVWLDTDPLGLSQGGSPDSQLHHIFSPDFIYHQINNGVDNGSTSSMAITLIVRTGGASWNQMPYDTSNHTQWPSEVAWREAPKYRGAEVGTQYWDYKSNGYFVIQEDSDIYLLKTLLAAGYMVSIGVQSDGSITIFNMLSSKDVADNDTSPLMIADHAGTVVGYKEGADWNPLNP